MSKSILRQLLIAVVLCAGCASSTGPKPIVVVPDKTETPGENVATAKILYEQAWQLAEEGKYEEACPKYEASDRLYHTPKTRFYLADCYERIGRLGSAWEKYTQLSIEAQERGDAESATNAYNRAEKLRTKLPQLTVVVPADVASLAEFELQKNGELLRPELWNKPLAVDPGDQVITANALHKQSRREVVKVGKGEQKTIKIGVLEPLPMSKQRVAGLVVGGGAVAGLIVGSVFGLLASSNWTAAEAKYCKPGRASCAPFSDQEAAYQKALTTSYVSTTGFVVGGAALAAAIILYVTGPVSDQAGSRTSLRLTPLVGPTTAGTAIGGTF